MISRSGRPEPVYLHIGTHKTGTTSIQEFLKQNREHLAVQGVATVVDDGILTKSLKQRAAHKVAEVISLGPAARKWRELREAVSTLPRTLPIVLSSERVFRYLSSSRDEQKRAALIDNIRTVFGEDLRFLLYVRNMGDYFNSLVAERIVATSESRPMDGVIQSLHHLADIQSVVQQLQSQLGPQVIRVCSFDAAIAGPGGLLTHFANEMEWGGVSGLRYPKGRFHSMPPAQFIALKYHLNSLELPKKIYRAARRQIAEIGARHKDSRAFRIIDDTAVDNAIELGRRLNPAIPAQMGVTDDVFFSEKVKKKAFVDISRADDRIMLNALVELYQASNLLDKKRIRIVSGSQGLDKDNVMVDRS